MSTASGDLLSRRDVKQKLGVPDSVVEAIFRAIPVVKFPGSRLVFIRSSDLDRLVARSTYTGSEVRA